MSFQNFFKIFLVWLFSHGLKIIAILVFAFFAIRFISTIISRMIKPLAREGSKVRGKIDRKILKQREKTLERVFISFSSVVIWVVALLMILPELGINTTPLLAGSGILGLAIGMSSHALIQDYISGLFILLEDQYRVGEEVNISGIRGKVKDFNLRRTILTDSKKTLHYIPNGQINKVANFSRGQKSQK